MSICKKEGIGGIAHNLPSHPLSLPPGHPPRANLGHLLETVQLRLGLEPKRWDLNLAKTQIGT